MVSRPLAYETWETSYVFFCLMCFLRVCGEHGSFSVLYPEYGCFPSLKDESLVAAGDWTHDVKGSAVDPFQIATIT